MSNFLLDSWSDIWKFLKQPKDKKDSNQSSRFKLKQLVSIFVLNIIIVTLLSFLIVLVEEIGWLSTENHMMNELMKTSSKWYILFIGVIRAPLFEELIFRLYLRKKYNPIRLISFIGGVIAPDSKDGLKSRIDFYWHKYYRIFFYSTAFLFGLVHIFNFELSVSVLIFTPLLVAPQFIIGLFLGYLRVRFGLLWAILLHFLHNLLALSVGLLLAQEPIEAFTVENNTYKLKVVESGFNASGSSINRLNNDTIVFENVQFKTALARLLEVEEELVDIKPENLRLQRLSFKFIAKEDMLEHTQIILKELQENLDFEIIETKETRDAWEIIIKDTIKLQENVSESAYSTYELKNGSIKLERATLQRLGEAINPNYQDFIFAEYDMNEEYNFQFELKSLEYLNRRLNDKYGLGLEKTTKTVDKIIIQF